MPQITIGAKEKWQPYFGDLYIIISVRYHTHTHTHTQTQNTHAPMRNQHQKKENEESQGCQSKKINKREARGIMVLKYLTFFSSFQEELA